MSKALDDRITAAMGQSGRLPAIAELIAEVVAATAEAQATHDTLDAMSKSASASEEEADRAADEAAKVARRIIRLGAKRAQLQQRQECLQEAERSQQRIATYEAVKADRDRLAEDLKTQGAGALEVIVDLIKRIAAQETKLAAVNASLPAGKTSLEDAEFVARGVLPNGLWPKGFDQAFRLTAMKVPHFARRGMAWPDEDGEAARQAAAYQKSLEAERKARLQREEREASRRHYTVQRTDTKPGTIRLHHANGIFGLGLQVWPCELYADQVAKAEAAGMIVTPIDTPALAEAQ